jgi:hypothetical protein
MEKRECEAFVQNARKRCKLSLTHSVSGYAKRKGQSKSQGRIVRDISFQVSSFT